MKTYIIDRFEENMAICETEENTIVKISRLDLPSESREGDILIQTKDETFYIDSEATKERRRKLEQLFSKLTIL